MNADCAVAGFDVGKSSSQFCVLAPDGQMHLKPTKIDNNPAGLKSAINTLKKVEEALGTKPAVVLESTGHYSMRLVHLFIRNDFEVFLINPLQSHSIKNLNIRKVKTDKIDCEEIARLFFISNLQKFKMPDENVANLKILTRYHHKFAQKRVKTMNQLKSCVDQCWPGFTEIFKDIASKTALSLLHAYPNPAQLLAAPKEEVITLIKTKSRQGKNYAEKKYRDLKRCAKEALEFGAQMDALNTCIKLLVSSIQEEDEKLKQLEAEINALAIEIPAVELLKSIPGIGDKLAPTIAAEIGDIDRFKNAKQLVAYCGIDPSVKQSGKFKGTKNKFTKRGSPHIRRALYIAAMVAVKKSDKDECVNEVIRDYYQQKIKNKPKNQALGAVMNKLVRIIFSVLKSRRAFVLITPERHKKLYAAGLLPAA